VWLAFEGGLFSCFSPLSKNARPTLLLPTKLSDRRSVLLGAILLAHTLLRRSAAKLAILSALVGLAICAFSPLGNLLIYPLEAALFRHGMPRRGRGRMASSCWGASIEAELSAAQRHGGGAAARPTASSRPRRHWRIAIRMRGWSSPAAVPILISNDAREGRLRPGRHLRKASASPNRGLIHGTGPRATRSRMPSSPKAAGWRRNQGEALACW